MKLRALFILALMVLLSAPVFAKPWTVDYTNSRLGFTGTQGDTPFDGSFKKFQADIDFDPAHPENSKINAIIDAGSATAGTAERDTYLPQADWFDAQKFSQAQFTSTAIRAAGTDKNGATCFEVDGNLTIKGITKPVKLPFCLKTEGDHMRAQARVKLIRTDFNIGLGQWASEAYVKHGVDVTVDIAAKP
jgi:polyisoprenoid-binding protein YceI